MKYNKKQKEVIKRLKALIKESYPDARTYIRANTFNSKCNELFCRIISRSFENKSRFSVIEECVKLLADTAENDPDYENGFFPLIVEPITPTMWANRKW